MSITVSLHLQKSANTELLSYAQAPPTSSVLVALVSGMGLPTVHIHQWVFWFHITPIPEWPFSLAFLSICQTNSGISASPSLNYASSRLLRSTLASVPNLLGPCQDVKLPTSMDSYLPHLQFSPPASGNFRTQCQEQEYPSASTYSLILTTSSGHSLLTSFSGSVHS